MDFDPTQTAQPADPVLAAQTPQGPTPQTPSPADATTQGDFGQTPEAGADAIAKAQSDAADAEQQAMADRHRAIGALVEKLGAGRTPTGKFFSGIVGGALAGMSAEPNKLENPGGSYISASPNIAGAAKNIVAQNNKNQERQDTLTQQAKADKQRDFENNMQLSDQTLRLAANARAQVQSIQNTQEGLLRRDLLQHSIANQKLDMAQKQIDNLVQNGQRVADIKDAGGELLSVNGKQSVYDATPGGMKQLMADAHDNPQAHIAGHLTREVFNPYTNKIEVYSIPDGEQDFAIKDAAGTTHNVRMTGSAYLDWAEKQGKVQAQVDAHNLSVARLNEMNTDKNRDKGYSIAMQDLDAADGDVTKVKPSTRRAILAGERPIYATAMAAVNASQKQIDAAREAGQEPDADDVALNTMAKQEAARSGSLIGSLYGKPPAPQLNPQAKANAPKSGDKQTHNGAIYVFNGKQWVKQ